MNLSDLPEEFGDVLLVMQEGAKKYPPGDGWLMGKAFSHRSNHASMCRHLAEHYMKVDKDHDTGLDPLLHLACRALMMYTLKKRGLPVKES